MKRILILLSIFLSVSLQGQIGRFPFHRPISTAEGFDGGLVTNGDFSDGETAWTDDNTNFPIESGYAEFKDLVSSNISQAVGDMVTGLTINTSYTFSCEITFVTATEVTFSVRRTDDYDMSGSKVYNTDGVKTFTITTAGYGGTQGFKVEASSGSVGSWRITNISINPL